MKLAIIGSLGFDNYDLLKSTLEQYKDKITEVVSGGTKGADSLGDRWANENDKNTNIFLPDWEKYGKRAGFVRNTDIVENSDAVIAFWDGESKGTQHSFGLCEKSNKPLKIIRY